MAISEDSYLGAQKAFWDTNEETSRLGRVDTISRTCSEYEERADRDSAIVFAGLEACIDADSRILEIGCGVGRLLSRLLARTAPKLVIGVDISAGMIAHARNALGTREDVLLATNSGQDLEMIASESIDIAFCNDVFIHVHDIDVMRRYLSEVRRVLKPSGVFRFNVRRMVLSTMFSNSPGGLLAKVSYAIGLRSPLKKAKNPVAGFSGLQYRERDMTRLIKEAGLEITTLFAEGSNGHQDGRIWCTCRRA
jgi:ubiquinone/menaquinone biosynthesis C-methylase UbiE